MKQIVYFSRKVEKDGEKFLSVWHYDTLGKKIKTDLHTFHHGAPEEYSHREAIFDHRFKCRLHDVDTHPANMARCYMPKENADFMFI